jgi:hypothetical protein
MGDRLTSMVTGGHGQRGRFGACRPCIDAGIFQYGAENALR